MSVSSSFCRSHTRFTVGDEAPSVEDFLAGKPATNLFGNMQVRLLYPHSSATFDHVSAIVDSGESTDAGGFVSYNSASAVISGTYTGEGSVLTM